GFEAFDAIGRSRTHDGPFEVDDHGQLAGTDVDGAFRGLVDLAGRLGRSETAAQCAAARVVSFALATTEATAPSCASPALMPRCAACGYVLRDLMVGVATAAVFPMRRVVETQGACQ